MNYEGSGCTQTAQTATNVCLDPRMERMQDLVDTLEKSLIGNLDAACHVRDRLFGQTTGPSNDCREASSPGYMEDIKSLIALSEKVRMIIISVAEVM